MEDSGAGEGAVIVAVFVVAGGSGTVGRRVRGGRAGKREGLGGCIGRRGGKYGGRGVVPVGKGELGGEFEGEIM